MVLAYFDCFSGISGDMILGAFLDLGFPVSALNDALEALHLNGYQIEALREERHHLSGIRYRVTLLRPDDHGRNYRSIRSLIEKSALPDTVKEKSVAIFDRLAAAEALIHNELPENVHFHEIGGIDSIIDVVGAVTAIHFLGIRRIVCSPLPLGSGLVTGKHGTIPVPAPATVELLKGVPVYGGSVSGELVTPTGAAIVATLAETFGALPPVRIKKIGYGVGENHRPEVPNMLRIILGEKEQSLLQGNIEMIETNIDDMNPEIYDYLFERLFAEGALDVMVIPAQMKKNRPAVLLKILALGKNKSGILRVLFEETSTLGIRCYPAERFTLDRRVREIETLWGKVKVKIAVKETGEEDASPEYEDCKRIAREHHIPLRKVFDEVKRVARGKAS